jgi:hypothetical protein
MLLFFHERQRTETSAQQTLEFAMVDTMRRCVLLSLVALVLAGCASTTLQSAWFDSSYKGGALKRILVVGVTGSFSDRRIFDDIFAQALNSAGVQGIPGYQFIDNAPSASADVFNDGVAKSGADGLLLVRLLAVDTRTTVATTMVPVIPGPMGGPYGNLGPWGPTWYAVPDVQQYQVANVEATLFDASSRRPIWSANTQTFNPTSVATETPGYAKLIIAQLSARGLLQSK